MTANKTGDLWYNGKKLESNLPFNILGAKKKEYISLGYKKEHLKIKYHDGRNF